MLKIMIIVLFILMLFSALPAVSAEEIPSVNEDELKIEPASINENPDLLRKNIDPTHTSLNELILLNQKWLMNLFIVVIFFVISITAGLIIFLQKIYTRLNGRINQESHQNVQEDLKALSQDISHLRTILEKEAELLDRRKNDKESSTGAESEQQDKEIGDEAAECKIEFINPDEKLTITEIETDAEMCFAADDIENAKGIEKFSEGKIEQAIECFSRAIQLNPDNGEAFFHRGIACIQLNQIKKALHDYRTALVLNPGSDKIHYNIALVNYRLNDYNEALKHFSQAVEINPKFEEAFYNRGLVNLKKKNQDAALADFSQAIRLNPSDEDAYYNRGNIRFAKKEFQASSADFSRVIELNPQKFQAYYNRGIIRLKLSDTDGAYEDQAKVVDLNPQYDPAYYNLGVIEDIRGNPKEAINNFSKAVALNQGNYHAYYYRANVLVDSGNYSAAISDYEKTLELQSGHINAALNYLEALIMTSGKFKWYEFNEKFKKLNLDYYNNGIYLYLCAIADCVFNKFTINNDEVSNLITKELSQHWQSINWSFEQLTSWVRTAETLSKKQKSEIKGLTARIAKFVKKHNKQKELRSTPQKK